MEVDHLECDNQYHSMIQLLAVFSTGWYSGGDRCLNFITISANGRSVKAKVVDECDSTMGCDGEHDYQPPCPNNIVDASKAVWEALGIPEGDWGDSISAHTSIQDNNTGPVQWKVPQVQYLLPVKCALTTTLQSKLDDDLKEVTSTTVAATMQVTSLLKPSGKIRGIKPPPGQCNPENDSDCCRQGKMYTTYKCSPPVTGNTKAVLTLNSFQKWWRWGGIPECDNQYHSDDTPVVALSTGWYSGGDRCLNYITINANGRSVKAKVVDECDSTMGCDDATRLSVHVRITLLMPLKQCGKPWVYLKVIGATHYMV
ncbi:hypothetical protein HAX54_020502 [Datura stramonium]|uniref:Uncharacterized protein n=1 Tax=Datura stramonium TaxID=4076 RepID=A0ABS8UR58_DATST|nr:hypothetical protein [Datura stramonium]